MLPSSPQGGWGRMGKHKQLACFVAPWDVVSPSHIHREHLGSDREVTQLGRKKTLVCVLQLSTYHVVTCPSGQ